MYILRNSKDFTENNDINPIYETLSDKYFYVLYEKYLYPYFKSESQRTR